MNAMNSTAVKPRKFWRWPKQIPKGGWGDEVINDLKKLKLKNLIQVIKDRKSWNDLMQKTKTDVGLYCKKKKKKKYSCIY